MTIAKILQTKGNTVVTAVASTTVSETVTLLARENYGAVVVVDAEDTVVGIVSERDVVQALAKGGGDTLSKPVSTIMTADPLTCTRDGAIADLLQVMTGWNIRHLPVVENRNLFGLVSMGDLIKSIVDSGIFDSSLAGRLALRDADSVDETSQ